MLTCRLLSLTLSARNSEGRLSDLVLGEDGGQRYYEVSESSGSGSEESVSSRTNPDFSCRGISSSLLVYNLVRIRKRYNLPDGFSLAVPRVPSDACFRQL